MTGIITGPITANPDIEAQGIEAVPSGVWEGSDPFSLTRSLGRYMGRQQDWQGPQIGPTPARGPAQHAPPPMLTSDQADEQYGIEGQLNFGEYKSGIPDAVAKNLYHAKLDELRLQDVARRAPSGIWNTAQRVGAGFIANALDPLNIAASFIPVVGEARYAEWLANAGSALGRAGVRAGVGAAAGVVGQVPLEALRYGLAKDENADWTATSALLDLAYGAALGGVLHAGGGGVADILTGRYRAGAKPGEAAAEPGVPSAPAAPAPPEPSTAPVAERPILAAEPAPRPIAEAVASLDPRTQEATLRTALAQSASDRPVEVGPEIAAGIEAFHGSPHDFDAFEWSPRTIGTGEGAQAYGHGLYFGEARGTGEEYQKNVIDKTYFDDVNKRLSALAKEMDQHRAGEYGKFKDTRGYELKAEYDRLMDERAAKKGTLYRVMIGADKNTFLDWDKPLSEQSPQIRAIAEHLWPAGQTYIHTLDSLGKVRYIAKSQIGELTGGELVNAARANTSPVDFAARLREAGIPGIRYLDQQSRGGGDGTRNFVVFDPNIVRITHKNDVPVAQPEARLSEALRHTVDPPLLDPTDLAMVKEAEAAETRPPVKAPPAPKAEKPREAPTIQKTPSRSGSGAPMSLGQFLSKAGGVKDTEGELRHLGIGVGTNLSRLIRKDGAHPDYAREAAIEAGYLPEGATLNDFYAAIGEEAKGKPVYSGKDLGSVQETAERKALLAELDKMGEDASHWSDAQINDYLEAHAGEADLDFAQSVLDEEIDRHAGDLLAGLEDDKLRDNAANDLDIPFEPVGRPPEGVGQATAPGEPGGSEPAAGGEGTVPQGGRGGTEGGRAAEGAQEGKLTFEQMVAAGRARVAEAKRLAAANEAVEFGPDQFGLAGIASADTVRPGGFRFTMLRDGEAVGHLEFDTLEEAIRNGLDGRHPIVELVPRATPLPTVEPTAAGGQAVIPGAERISDRQLAERKMAAPKRGAKEQKPADEGLFDTGARAQTDMLDQINENQGLLARDMAEVEKGPLTPDDAAELAAGDAEMAKADNLSRAYEAALNCPAVKG